MTPLIDIVEFSRLLHLAKSTVYKLSSAKKIPHCKIGGKLLFSVEKLRDWIEEHEIKTLN